jgi:hypothetical protein
MGSTYVPIIIEWIKIMVHIHDVILFSHKEKWNPVICPKWMELKDTKLHCFGYIPKSGIAG